MVELDHRRIEALEDIRQGGDLTFSATLWAHVKYRNDMEISTDTLTHFINQGVWVKILKELGYAELLLLEVPVPNSNIHPEFSKAVKHLEKAHRFMMQGYWRDAVGTCRNVLESLRVALGERKYKDPTTDPWFANLREKSKDERLEIIRKALEVYTHPAHHADENAAGIEWDRTDAVAMLSILSALLGCYMKPAKVSE
ncbi:MAG TPA: hypothetical protein VGK27_06870 [Candidatus Deferrimicrobiaceae bacterium]|jgi:hypothetical protein